MSICIAKGPSNYSHLLIERLHALQFSSKPESLRWLKSGYMGASPEFDIPWCHPFISPVDWIRLVRSSSGTTVSTLERTHDRAVNRKCDRFSVSPCRPRHWGWEIPDQNSAAFNRLCCYSLFALIVLKGSELVYSPGAACSNFCSLVIFKAVLSLSMKIYQRLGLGLKGSQSGFYLISLSFRAKELPDLQCKESRYMRSNHLRALHHDPWPFETN